MQGIKNTRTLGRDPGPPTPRPIHGRTGFSRQASDRAELWFCVLTALSLHVLEVFLPDLQRPSVSVGARAGPTHDSSVWSLSDKCEPPPPSS